MPYLVKISLCETEHVNFTWMDHMNARSRNLIKKGRNRARYIASNRPNGIYLDSHDREQVWMASYEMQRNNGRINIKDHEWRNQEPLSAKSSGKAFLRKCVFFVEIYYIISYTIDMTSRKWLVKMLAWQRLRSSIMQSRKLRSVDRRSRVSELVSWLVGDIKHRRSSGPFFGYVLCLAPCQTHLGL